MTILHTFWTEIAPGLGVGDAPAGWRSLAEASLLILVGVTGVGKSATVDALGQLGVDFALLPNRRELTDKLIIGYLQQQDGEPRRPVRDRQQRFDYTRRYREANPGGMAHLLDRLWVDPTQRTGLLLFDGLRGEEEVSYAAERLPQARFVVLDAPDMVRVQRLLGRNDAFDRVGDAVAPPAGDDVDAHLRDFDALGVAEARHLFSPGEERALLDLARRGEVPAAELAAKLRIVVGERRNYDPAAAILVLENLAPDRTLVVDTVTNDPVAVAYAVRRFLIRWQDDKVTR